MGGDTTDGLGTGEPERATVFDRPLPALNAKEGSGPGGRGRPPIARRVRILIADYAPTRLGIRMALGDLAEVCAEASDAEQAIRAAEREHPEICLVGRDIPGGGLRAVRGITQAAQGTAVVLLAEAGDADDLLDAVRGGAVGYVPGKIDASRLRRIVAAVEANEAVVPRAMVLDLLLELRGAGTDPAHLTGRERQVLGLLRRGHSTAAIARRLHIAPVTVRRHVSTLVNKLGVEDRSALIGQPQEAQRPR